MLGDAGSIASLVGLIGVPISLIGLIIAILQIRKLRGETRAARQASEETRRAVSRDLVLGDLIRISERIQALKELHRRDEWAQALHLYPELQRGLITIRSRYSGLSQVDSVKVWQGITRLQHIERIVEAVELARAEIPPQLVSEFNGQLTDIQSTLAELAIQLEQSP